MICSDFSLDKLSCKKLADKIVQSAHDIYRDLPWRNSDDEYAVYISEVMLQQTQVSRVLNYWSAWMRRFPSVESVSLAEVSDILDFWQGLGYNRRALAIKKTCDICTASYGGKLPRAYEDLLALPGIGKSTAAGICAFAFNEPCLYIETNVRTVLIHEYLSDASRVQDSLLEKILSLLLEECLAQNMTVRSFYYALLDMGSVLKKTQGNANRQSTTYTKQSPFEGSLRQKRSFIIQALLYAKDDRLLSRESLFSDLNEHELSCSRQTLKEDTFNALIEQLIHEGFVQEQDGTISIASARKDCN